MKPCVTHSCTLICHRECVSRPWNGGCEIGDGKLVMKTRGSGFFLGSLSFFFVRGNSYTID
jgi:hypothetical protein